MEYQISPVSKFTIQLATAGVLGFLGHEHNIQAPIADGTVVYDAGQPTRSSVTLEVKTAQIRVLDPDLGEKDRQETQQTMEGPKVLNISEYPFITFQSTSLKAVGNGEYQVIGHLTIRDTTRPVEVAVKVILTEETLTAEGRANFRQTSFGIEPVTAGLGAVKVADVVRLTFQLEARAR